MSSVLDPFRFVLISVAGWMNQQQLHAIDGYGANSACSHFEGRITHSIESCSKLCGQSGSHALWRSGYRSAELAGLELVLLDLLREFDAGDHPRRIPESFEPGHRPNPLFHSPMVLFNQVVEVLAGTDRHSSRKFSIFLHLPYRSMRGRI